MSKLFNNILREAAMIENPEQAKKIALEICQKIKDEGYTAWLVGGCVRDEILGKSCDDYDFVTDMPLSDASKIGEIIRDSGKKVDGATYLIEVEGIEFDIRFLGKYSVKSDLVNRDLTMNAIAWDPISDEYIDPSHGKDHLKRGVIEFCPGSKAMISKGRLPRYVFRCLRFLGQLGFELGPSSFDAIQKFAEIHKDEPEGVKCGVERPEIFEKNWKKMTSGPGASEALEIMKDIGMYDYCKKKFPDIIKD